MDDGNKRSGNNHNSSNHNNNNNNPRHSLHGRVSPPRRSCIRQCSAARETPLEAGARWHGGVASLCLLSGSWPASFRASLRASRFATPATGERRARRSRFPGGISVPLHGERALVTSRGVRGLWKWKWKWKLNIHYVLLKQRYISSRPVSSFPYQDPGPERRPPSIESHRQSGRVFLALTHLTDHRISRRPVYDVGSSSTHRTPPAIYRNAPANPARPIRTLPAPRTTLPAPLFPVSEADAAEAVVVRLPVATLSADPLVDCVRVALEGGAAVAVAAVDVDGDGGALETTLAVEVVAYAQ
ncbi:hypothetical protein B2J93_8867 [Marssonina coronariae]|uniref:Uncharacterized protein n=1 Tax=Diplocarpon coronariae TaxID=2795749 RepID=A0A218ZGS8_9HELO|nr:hypothetical protein B2J93_8867 [Marssonina coronariae]